jgi:glycerate kinase
MNILIAPDSFKDSLSAKAVADHISKGVARAMPETQITKIHLSDGGEGLLDALILPRGGKLIETKVKDPLSREIKAEYGILPDTKTAVVEMAKASGLELLKPNERNPLVTSTFGTGQLIKDALDKGCTKIIVGLGGSATNDGGLGMIKALGGRFLDEQGKAIGEGGEALDKLHHIDLSELDRRISRCDIIVACDVTNPLTGSNGASLVYGKQKDGTPEALTKLDNNLAHYANIIHKVFGKDYSSVEGTGAAGGTAMGLLAFLDAELKPGIELIMQELQLEKHIKQADLVITG